MKLQKLKSLVVVAALPAVIIAGFPARAQAQQQMPDIVVTARRLPPLQPISMTSINQFGSIMSALNGNMKNIDAKDLSTIKQMLANVQDGGLTIYAAAYQMLPAEMPAAEKHKIAYEIRTAIIQKYVSLGSAALKAMGPAGWENMALSTAVGVGSKHLPQDIVVTGVRPIAVIAPPTNAVTPPKNPAPNVPVPDDGEEIVVTAKKMKKAKEMPQEDPYEDKCK